MRAEKVMMMAIFASSEGWKRMPATSIQRLAPLAVEPMIGTSMRKNTETSRMMNEALRQS